jgi:hypothetical protein
MILELLGKQYHYDNDTTQIAPLLQTIEDHIKSDDELYVQCYTVDERDIYDSLDKYIMEHIESVNRIEVKLMDKGQLCSSLINEGKDYIARAIPSMNTLADLFYQSPGKEAWERLEQLLEAFSWFDDVLEILGAYFTADHQISLIKKQLKNMILEFHDAINNNDSVLIADVIVHEFIPIFENLQSTLETLDKGEITNNDISG